MERAKEYAAFFPEKLRTVMKTKGFKKIGEGQDSLVYAVPNNPREVLKIFSASAWAPRRYLEFCIANPSNPHLLKVSDLRYSKSYGGIYMALVERLAIPSNEIDIAVDLLSSKVWGRSQEIVKNRAKAKGLSPLKVTKLAEKLNPVLAPTLKVLLKASPKGKQSLDTTSENIGLRGSTIVFLDPWASPFQTLY